MAINSLNVCNGFISFNQSNAKTLRHAMLQKLELLKIHLNIAQEVLNMNHENTGNRLGIEGLTIKLRGDKEAAYKQCVMFEILI